MNAIKLNFIESNKCLLDILLLIEEAEERDGIKLHPVHVDTMTSVHRVVVSQDTYQALQAEALVRQVSIQVVMDSIILDHISPQAREILNTLGAPGPVDYAAIATDKPAEPASQQSTQAGRTRQLARDKAAVAQIKKLWTTTDLSITEIAAQVDAPRQTVDGLIKRLIDRRELAQRAESGQISGEKV